MSSNFNAKRRPNRSSSSTTGNVRYDKIYIGTVMANSDPESMGRLLVYIPELGGSLSDSDNWFLVNYASPFAGATNAWPNVLNNEGGNTRDGQTYNDTQTSYGFWMVPPDLNNQVLVAFAAGDPNRGFWFACLFQKDMNHMVPGISSDVSYQGQVNGVNQPVAEYNKNQSAPDIKTTQIRPSHPLREALQKQGLSIDILRGVTTAGARRETPSNVFGILTPGGSQFVMDDGGNAEEDNSNNSEFIRLRTVGGAQVLISETFGHVYMISKDGNSWVELNNDGNIDIYGHLNINIHGESDINLCAGQDINMEAGRNINMKAKTGDFLLFTQQGNIQMTANSNYFLTVGQNGNIKVGKGILTSSENYDLNISNTYRMAAGNEYDQYVGNTLRLSNTRGALISASNAGTPTAATLPTINPLPLNKTVTSSITSRVPEHEPWAVHTVAANTADPASYQPTFNPSAQQDLENESSPNDGCTPPQNIAGLTTSNRGLLFIAGQNTTPLTFYSSKNSNDNNYRIGYSNYDTLSNQLNDFSYGITENSAWQAFQSSIQLTAENTVKSNITVPLNQAQFDALVSLVADQGEGALGQIKDTINSGGDGASAINSITSNTNRRRLESILYTSCNYGSLGDRCTWTKKALSDAKNAYQGQPSTIQQQIQGSFYQMNITNPAPPGGTAFNSALEQQFPKSVVQAYVSQCTVQQAAQQTANSTSPLFVGDIQLSPHFWLHDLIASSTATQLGVSNQPTDNDVENLKALCVNVLEKILTMPGLTGIKINSGYRSAALNQALEDEGYAVAKASQHMTGQAADILPVGGVTTLQLAQWIKENLQYDQLILERRNLQWVHVSWNSSGNRADDGRTKYMSWNTNTGQKFYGQLVNV